MKLTPKGKKRQAAIANALKKGLPLVGLLSSLMVTTGCDFVKGLIPRTTMGKMVAPKPSKITPTEQVEEPTVQPSQDQQQDSPDKQNNEIEPRPLMGKPAPSFYENKAENTFKKICPD